MPRQVVVIGAGFSGLSVAALLLQKGYQVQILEKNAEAGGRARLWSQQGYHFDMGPSWYLMPEVFDRFFAKLDRRREDYYALEKLKTYYKVFFEGADHVTITDDRAANKRVFDGLEPEGGAKLEAYLAKAAYKYDVAVGEFLYRDYKNLFQFFNRRLMTEGLKLDVFTSLDKFVGKYFTDIRARQILEYAMVFLGSSPQNAPALYSLMSHVDLNQGVFFPKGGLNGVARGMETLVRELGGVIHYNRDVTKIHVVNGQARGVEAGGETFSADLVVNAGDYAWGETQLLERPWQSYPEGYWKKRVVAPSMLIAYLGVKKAIPGLEHHNLYFSKDWNAHFDTIFKKPSWPENPCFYLSAITKTDKAMAPAGAENLFLLIPAAPGLADDPAWREDYLERQLIHVEQVTGTRFRQDIEVRRAFSQRDFEADYHAFQGTALGLSHTLFQTAVFRPSHRSKRVANLYYTGQYTHPGVGVPMCLIASEITAEEIERQWPKR